MTATTSGVDIVEVLRGATAGPWLIAAGAVGGVAAMATVVAVVAWWSGETRRDGDDADDRRDAAGTRRDGESTDGRGRAAGTRRLDGVTVSLSLALIASLLEVGLLVADGAGPDDRWLAVVGTRVLVLATLLAVVRDDRRQRRPALPWAVRAGLALVLVVTAALGAPATALSGQVWLATAVTVGLAGLVGLGWRFMTGAGRLAPAAAAALLTVLAGGPVATWTTPDAVPPHHQERVAVDGVVLDLTIAPVRAGTNEAHLYAFDADGGPVPVSDVHLAVAGISGSEHAMFEVSPDHHLSYALELPAEPPWTVSFSLTGADGRPREVSLRLDRP